MAVSLNEETLRLIEDRMSQYGVKSADKLVRIAGRQFRVVGVSAKKGAFFGNSLDEFAVIPLGQPVANISSAAGIVTAV